VTAEPGTSRDTWRAARRQPNPYEVLQVSPGASPEVIRAAYHALARAYHPDVARSRHSTGRMQQLNAAYAALSDPVRRAQYAAQYRQAERLPSRQSASRRRLIASAEQAGSAARARPATRTAAIVVGAAVLSALVITFWLVGDLLDEPPSSANLADPAAVHQLVLNSR
jgi:curved DNA-binding protein CbpA